MTKRKWASHARTFALAFAAVGALVWTGCKDDGASGSYYCDATGCYSCDGYSCRSVPAPGATTCTGSAGCAGGYVCTTLGCEQTCASNSDCSDGLVCTSGLCAPPGQPPGTPIGCTTNLDCPTGDTCVSHECVATDGGIPTPPIDAGPGTDTGVDAGPTCGGTLGPCACTSDKQCAAGQVCVAGACTASSNACKYDSECPAGDVCADGQCVPDCSAKACPTGYTCVKGACEAPPTGGGCTTGAQCPSGTPVCVAGHCSAACTADAQCPSGDYCNQGACVPDTRPPPNCTPTGGQCGATQQCVTGFCRYTCNTSQQCQLIDARIPVCSADGVCRSASEGNPQCTSKDQCAQGQDCIGNVCK